MNLSNHIEALLFLNGEPIQTGRLEKILDKSEEEIIEALKELEEILKNRGLRLVQNKNEVSLGTAPESSVYCESLIREETDKNIGKAGLEVLAVVLYKGALKKEGVSRIEIDHIRGVNSTFTLRNLSIRGLVERKINPADKRSFVYSPSTQLLRFLGITKKEDLPKFEEFVKQMDNYLKEAKDAAANNQNN